METFNLNTKKLKALGLVLALILTAGGTVYPWLVLAWPVLLPFSIAFSLTSVVGVLCIVMISILFCVAFLFSANAFYRLCVTSFYKKQEESNKMFPDAEKDKEKLDPKNEINSKVTVDEYKNIEPEKVNKPSKLLSDVDLKKSELQDNQDNKVVELQEIKDSHFQKVMRKRKKKSELKKKDHESGNNNKDLVVKKSREIILDKSTKTINGTQASSTTLSESDNKQKGDTNQIVKKKRRVHPEFEKIVEESPSVSLDQALQYVDLGCQVMEAMKKGENGAKVLEQVKQHKLFKELLKKNSNKYKNNPDAQDAAAVRLMMASTFDWYLQFLDSARKRESDSERAYPYNWAFKEGARVINDLKILNLVCGILKDQRAPLVYQRLSSHFKGQVVNPWSLGIDFKPDSDVLLSFGKQTLLISELTKGRLFIKPERFGCYDLSHIFLHGIDFLWTRFDDSYQGDKKDFRKEHPDQSLMEQCLAFMGVCRHFLVGVEDKNVFDKDKKSLLKQLNDKKQIKKDFKEQGYAAAFQYIKKMEGLLKKVKVKIDTFNLSPLNKKDKSEEEVVEDGFIDAAQYFKETIMGGFIEVDKELQMKVDNMIKGLVAIKEKINQLQPNAANHDAKGNENVYVENDFETNVNVLNYYSNADKEQGLCFAGAIEDGWFELNDDLEESIKNKPDAPTPSNSVSSFSLSESFDDEITGAENDKALFLAAGTLNSDLNEVVEPCIVL